MPALSGSPIPGSAPWRWSSSTCAPWRPMATGEVVFADAEGRAHSRRWTFRQGARSVVRPPTDRVLVVAEALHASAGTDVAALGDEVRSGLAVAGARVVAWKAIGPADRRLE